jgi:hypothetical protein
MAPDEPHGSSHRHDRHEYDGKDYRVDAAEKGEALPVKCDGYEAGEVRPGAAFTESWPDSFEYPQSIRDARHEADGAHGERPPTELLCGQHVNRQRAI